MGRIYWTKDELILSMHLYLDSKSKYNDIPKNASELEELSELFRKLHLTLGGEIGGTNTKCRIYLRTYAKL